MRHGSEPTETRPGVALTVVDASALVDALVGIGPHGASAREELRGLDLLQVPGVFLAEVISALRTMVLAGDLAPGPARVAAIQAGDVRTQEHSFTPFLHRIWELRNNLTPYDAWYVAVAEALEEPLVTADGRLAHSPGLRCEVVLTTG